MWSARLPRVVAGAGAAAAGLHLATRQYLEAQNLCSASSYADVAFCLSKGLLEGDHFRSGLGDRFEEAMEAIVRMKCTPPAKIDLQWRSGWVERRSDLTGRSVWARRGGFASPISEILPSDANCATVWELRGSSPVEEDTGGDEDLRLPDVTVWLGVPALDRVFDAAVRYANAVPARQHDGSDGSDTAILLLPDFGGEFCKRTLPVAELVVAELPAASVFLLEMPFRGTRKPPGYIGSVLHTVEEMMHMGCAIIEESRGLMGWLRAQGRASRMTVSGISMGGHMAALTACCSPDVGRLCMLLPSHSAEANWTDGGVMGMNRAISSEVVKPYLYSATCIDTYPSCSVERAVLVAAKSDGYVPLWSSERLRDSLVGQHVPVEFRTLSGGHVRGFLAHHADFAQAIVDVTVDPRL